MVKCFIHGRQLLDSLTEYHKDLPNFILMDLNMPILNGKETLKLLRKNTITSQIPVIIFSTSTNAGEKAHCMQFGADNYLSKPSASNVYDEIMQRLKRDYIDRIAIS
ncbi:MAG: response regulator [Bacteroidetes bacterium]|nr:response regulator [Bacteroidota bacterium]